MTGRRPRSGSNLVLAGSLLAVLAGFGHAAGPTVDCRSPRAGSIDPVICGSSLLSSLDAEATRLQALVTASASAPAAGSSVAAVETDQRERLERRDQCVKGAAPERCALDEYLGRIAALRATSDATRGDEQGISRGPFAWQCDDGAGPLAAVFVNSDPAFLIVRRQNVALTMWRAVSASGARYQGPDDAMFWEHQGEIRFRERAGSPEVTCTSDQRTR
jgi:membrane-bound inhibitor of C-type lysozyme